MTRKTPQPGSFLVPRDWPTQPIRIDVVGVGGTGSQIMSGLARLHIALRSLGHPHGLHVVAWDGDNVSTANIGRQLFSPGDIGRNKAIVTVNRINAFFGLGWEARPKRFDTVAKGYNILYSNLPGLVITCVDTAAARREISQQVCDAANRWNTRLPLWLDCGNSQTSGQVMMAAFGRGILKGPDGRSYPYMEQLLPEIFDEAIPEDDKPSCSLAEALQTQDLFINQGISTWALHLLWSFIREGSTDVCGYWINLGEGRVVPVPLPKIPATYRPIKKGVVS